MNKELKEMTAAGSGATIGPIQPLGTDPDRVEEMLKLHDDLSEIHVVAFATQAFRQRPADQLFVVDDENRGV